MEAGIVWISTIPYHLSFLSLIHPFLFLLPCYFYLFALISLFSFSILSFHILINTSPSLSLLQNFTGIPLCNDSRRVWFGVVCLLLVFSTIASAGLTVYTRRDYMAAWNRTYNLPPAPEESDKKLEDYRFCYSMSLTILAFCSTLCVGVGCLWILSECYVWPRERSLRLQLNALNEQHLQELQEFRENRNAPS